MTLKAFILLYAIVFAILLLIGMSATQQSDIAAIKQSDTINDLRKIEAERREFELFINGVLGQEPSKSN